MMLTSAQLRLTILLLLLVVLPALYFLPALFFGKTQVYGDSIFHGLALLTLHRESLFEWQVPLWSSAIYGGHPLYAEGHIGFFNPLMLVVSLLFEPIYGQNFFHFLCMSVSGFGCYKLCCELGRSQLAAVTVSLAVIFSSLWLDVQGNITVSGTLAWAPWSMWAIERWLKNIDIRNTAIVSLLLGLILLSGYPQVFHAVIIAMVIIAVFVLFPVVFQAESSFSTARFGGLGVVVVVLTCGLASVQLLPLLELAAESHRQAGSELFPVDTQAYLNGLLFSRDPAAKVGSAAYYPVVGSSLLCLMACLSLVLGPKRHEWGYICAAAFLILLGLGQGFWLHPFLIDSGLLPGLKFFRLTAIYFNVAIICLAVLAAFSIDRLSGHALRPKLVAAMVVIFFALVFVAYFEGAMVNSAYITVLAVAGSVVLVVAGKSRWLGYGLLVLVILEILITRMHLVRFVELEVLKPPKVIEYIQQDDSQGHYKTFELTNTGYPFIPSYSVAFDKFGATQIMLASLFPSSNLMWGLSSIQGAHALKLSRRALVDQQLRDEVYGKSHLAQGIRLLDYLGVRYITTKLQSDGFQTVEVLANGVRFVQNNYAQPKFQLFNCIQPVASPEQALAALQTLARRTLVIEGLRGGDAGLACNKTETDAGSVKVLEDSNTLYRFNSSSKTDLWLFIADANYPGWSATIDGNPVDIFSAQVLGKAIRVPSGEHEIRLVYRSSFFFVGTLLSVAALLVIIICLLPFWSNKRGPKAGETM